jgi:RNA polymerase sigma-70 factor, ECF subfamily
MGMHARNSDPAALVVERFEVEQVCRAIAALPEDYRIVSALYFMEEFSYQEIAEMVGCPVGTVRSRLHRGRRMLQRGLWHIAEQQGIVADLRASGE